MCVLNNIAVRKSLHYKQEWLRTFVVPGLASLIMGVLAYLSYQGIKKQVEALEAKGILPEGASPVIMLSLLALAGFFLYGPQALYCVVTGKHATKKAASAAAGLVGLFCYVSVLFTGLGIGFLSDTFGQDFWNNLFIIMAGVSVLSAAVLIPIWNIKDDGYLHEA